MADPQFVCQSCGSAFSIAPHILAKYPGWSPKVCLKCKKPRAGGSARSSKRSGGRRGGGRPSAAAAGLREENLRLAEVLERYTAGPDTGLFTDGACVPNPGPGGWGAVWVKGGEVVEQRYGHEADTTNNRMEMTAIIAALRLVPPDAEETLYTDSKLCRDTLEQWARGWAKNGWKRKAGPIKNLDLVQEAYALRQERPRLRLEHIAAHAGNRWNEYADSLATAWMREEL